jgi:TatD DNase family protein
MEQTNNKRGKKLEPSIDSTFNSKVVAIGEIGLDYYWDTAPHDVQKTLLLKQLGLASELELPVVLHFREKDDAQDGPCAAELLDILEVWVKSLREAGSAISDHPGVLHSFSGSLDSAKRAIGLHFKLGVTGPVVYSRKRQEIIAGLRLDDLLVETDSPYLSPTPRQGRRNEPANVIMIADKIAVLQSCKREEAAEVTSANARRLFGWDN